LTLRNGLGLSVRLRGIQMLFTLAACRRDADRRCHDRIQVFVEPQLPQHFLDDLRACGNMGFGTKMPLRSGYKR
jgi:hypothetical protein